MIFESINYASMTNDEMATFVQRMLGHTTSASSETLVLTSMNDVIGQGLQHYLECMAKSKTSPYTDILFLKDKNRDNAFLRFRYYTKSCTYDPDPDVSEAAENLYKLIYEVGFSLHVGSNKTQTSKMETLKERLTTSPAQEWVTKINADTMVAYIWTCQDDFEATRKQKVETEAVIDHTSATEVRKKLESQIRSALNMLASNYRFLGGDELKTLIDALNEEIVASMRVAKARATRNSNSDEE